MDLQSLPQYRGLPDSPRAWGKPDEQGKLPRMHLRDYVVLSLLVALCMPILLRLLVDSWVFHRKVTAFDDARYHQVEQEVSQDLRGGKRDVP